MLRLSFHKNFRIFSFLFFVSAISVTAQESKLYNDILKDALKQDFIKQTVSLEMDSSLSNAQLFEQMNEENLYRILFRHRIEFLLPEEKTGHFEIRMSELSFPAIQFFYTNAKSEHWDKGKFNGDGTFSGEFATKGDILQSKATRGMVNVPELIFLLVSKTGIIPATDADAEKESEKDKVLKIIKEDVYHIED